MEKERKMKGDIPYENTRTETRREESLRFVTAHYRHGAFDVRRDWRDLGLQPRPWLRRHAAAAALWAGVLTAAAAAAWWLIPSPEPKATAPDQPAPPPVETTTDPAGISRRIEFEDATVAEIAEAVSRIYGVRLENLPDNAPCLTLSYEGDAYDLAETINTLLGSDIRVAARASASDTESKTHQ